MVIVAGAKDEFTSNGLIHGVLQIRLNFPFRFGVVMDVGGCL